MLIVIGKNKQTNKQKKPTNLQPKLLYSAKISFIFDRENKSFIDKQKLREFSTTIKELI